MLLYKQGRFYYNGVSFPLPDNLYLYTDSGVETDNGILFANEDKTIVVELGVNDTYSKVDYDLNKMVAEAGYYYIIPITPVEINGLNGYYAVYRNKKTQHFEIRLDIGDSNELTYCISAENGQNVVDLIKLEAYKTLIEDIRKE